MILAFFKKYNFFIAGILLAFAFAPFHLPGFAFISLAILFLHLETTSNLTKIFLKGLLFGIGFFGFGASWIFISIKEYGNLNIPVSLLITLLFIFYLSIYYGLSALIYKKISENKSDLFKPLAFAASFCITEYLRASFLNGFPWLILGVSQIDTPISYLLPIFGVYIGSFLVCFSSACLYFAYKYSKKLRMIWLSLFILPIISPAFIKFHIWTHQQDKAFSVAIIQANLSMQEKWDEKQFWQILKNYEQKIYQVINNNKIIVLPESAIPLPSYYISDFLNDLDTKAKIHNSAILLGIPEISEDKSYYNAILSLGNANGKYFKQHLVPFGEYIPSVFKSICNKLKIPITDLASGSQNQPLIKVHNKNIASLICYEIAYPELLRKQLKSSSWILTISDDGWFGHSLAIYQHLQLAQVLSLVSGRYQIMANNDGLSAIIDNKGKIINKLKAFVPDVLEGQIFNTFGITPWTNWGDMPILIFCLIICIISMLIKSTLNENIYIAKNLLNNK